MRLGTYLLTSRVYELQLLLPLTPGMAQSPVSVLLMATNSSTGLPSLMTLLPAASLFHLQRIKHTVDKKKSLQGTNVK